MKVLQPAGWKAPRGYVNGVAASGTQVHVAGQIGWNAQCVFESDDLVAQVRQALVNVRAVLAEAGAQPEHIVRMTWYLTDKREYLKRAKEIGAAYREVIGATAGAARGAAALPCTHRCRPRTRGTAMAAIRGSHSERAFPPCR
jgi:enamine deaminase RidA (YjgF/YER057c/UK114 family)